MNKAQLATRIATSGLLAASAYIAYWRGGALAWAGLVIAIVLLAKQLVRPSHSDAALVLGILVLWSASWAAAWGYVRSTWESGEVVEVGVRVSDRIHMARVWILDVDGDQVMYYDAPPQVGRALIEHAPMTVQRGDQTLSGCAEATPVDDLPEGELSRLFAAMEAKYQERNRATDVFYILLGVERDRIGLVLRIKECSPAGEASIGSRTQAPTHVTRVTRPSVTLLVRA